MTIAQQFAAKASVAFVAAAMIISFMAPAAQAQSTDELQAMINTLMAQIAALQSQVGQGATSVASGVCPYTWTRDLSQGSTGPDVMKLQQFLNADADTRVAASGAGSVGAETEYYGPATAAAVSKMQVKYRAEILSPAGLVNPTGYFGPSSRAKANSVCVAAPVVPSTPDVDVDNGDDNGGDDNDNNNGSVTLRGEATLDTFEVEDADDTTIEEGDEEVAIGVFTVEFTNGDAEISRLDIALDRTGSGGEQDPWDSFETISLWVDGDMIAEVAADDRDEYLNRTAGTLRFSNLALVAMEDEEVEITVGATIPSAIKNLDNNGDEWSLKATALRYFDADGVATTETASNNGVIDSNDAAVFTIEEAGENEEVKVSLSTTNPNASDIVVDDTSSTNDVTIMAFDLEAKDGDIDLTKLVVRVDTTGVSTTKVVNDIELVIDGQTFRDESIDGVGAPTGNKSKLTSVAGEAVWYVFDIDQDITLDEDDKVTVEVVVDFKSQTGNYSNGQTIKATIGTTEKTYWIAEGANDLTAPGDFSGTAIGKEHTLVAEGIVLPRDGVTNKFTTQGQNDTIGIFEMKFEVTAVENDFYIRDLATLGSSATTGVEFTVDTPGGFIGASSSISAVLDSSADEDTAGVFTVREGTTETFTLKVTIDPNVAGSYRVNLTGVNYAENTNGFYVTAGNDGDLYVPIPVTDFRTNQENINN